jgi:hypothetical protein
MRKTHLSLAIVALAALALAPAAAQHANAPSLSGITTVSPTPRFPSSIAPPRWPESSQTVSKTKRKKGDRSFFVDESGVIRQTSPLQPTPCKDCKPLEN